MEIKIYKVDMHEQELVETILLLEDIQRNWYQYKQ